MRWSEIIPRVLEAFSAFALSEDDANAIRQLLEARGATNIRIVGNRVVFDIPHIPLKYIKRGNSIEKVKEDPHKGLFNVHFEVSRVGNRWVIVDVQPEYGDHPNWFPSQNWLCTGDIKLSSSSLTSLIDHVISSLEMGTERVDDIPVVATKSRLITLLLEGGDD